MVWRTIIIVLIVALFMFMVTHPSPTVTVAPVQSATSTPQTAAPVIAIAAVQGAFEATGTLVFYPNNVGPVPYFFYTDQSGNTAAKALIFDNLPPTDFSSWSGARIAVNGVSDREHVIVQQITYLAPP